MASRVEYPEKLRRGPFLGSEAVAAGLITHKRLRGPGWWRLLPNTYIMAGSTIDHWTWCNAVLLTAPKGSVLGYRSALGVHCLSMMSHQGEPVDLVVPPASRLRPHPMRRVHLDELQPGDMCVFAGYPVTTPARTGFDLARGEDLVEAVVCVDALLDAGVVNVAEMAAFLPRSLPGSSRAAKALALAVAGAQSPMESRTRLVLVLGGLPTPQTQVEVYDDAGGFIARLDLAYPEWRIGIEYDGDDHRDRERFRRDAVRANRLRLAGWTVLRFTADDVLRNPQRVLRQVHELLEAKA